MMDEYRTEKAKFDVDVGGDVPVIRPRPPNKVRRVAVRWNDWGRVSALGFDIAIPIVGGALLGAYVDRRLFTYPKATLLLLFVGVGIGIATFIKRVKEIMSKDS